MFKNLYCKFIAHTVHNDSCGRCGRYIDDSALGDWIKGRGYGWSRIRIVDIYLHVKVSLYWSIYLHAKRAVKGFCWRVFAPRSYAREQARIEAWLKANPPQIGRWGDVQWITGNKVVR